VEREHALAIGRKKEDGENERERERAREQASRRTSGWAREIEREGELVCERVYYVLESAECLYTHRCQRVYVYIYKHIYM